MRPFDQKTLENLRAILAGRAAIEIDPGSHRRACVIAPLIEGEGGWSLLFLRRSENLSAHSGQIAFPGGGVEEGETLIEAALREAEEEVGVPRDQIEVIGRLDDLITISGFVVAPFVALIPSRFEYLLQESEVAEVFEVPIEELMREGNPSVRYVAFRDRDYPSYFYDCGEVEVWGLTGRMVKSLVDFIRLAT